AHNRDPPSRRDVELSPPTCLRATRGRGGLREVGARRAGRDGEPPRPGPGEEQLPPLVGAGPNRPEGPPPRRAYGAYPRREPTGGGSAPGPFPRICATSASISSPAARRAAGVVGYLRIRCR